MNGKKRSANEAFGGRHESKVQNKVVYFSDNDDGENRAPSRSAANRDNSQSEKSTSRPNLKQHAKDLQPVRQQLPIWPHADEIRTKLRNHDALLLVGETGSGKSTQIPQFLINESWCRRRKLPDGSQVGGCIAITQPRRVAAISLARRVAEEMGTPLGTSSPASLVGYSVRFDNCTGPSTRIKFLTEGMLLQEMLRDPWLKEYSAVVVDEVHERGVNVDLALGFLRRLNEIKSKDDGRGGVGMKVVVMSATADMEKVKGFLEASKLQTKAVKGHMNGNSKNKANSKPGAAQAEWDGLSDQEPDDEDTPPIPESKPDKPIVATQFIKGRQYPVQIQYTPTPIADVLDAAYNRIVHIHNHSPLPGDILVFLTGQETVESLLHLIESYSKSIQKDIKLSTTLPQILVLPLYAALPSHIQQRVFQSTPKFTRKIILATNIAETSITVPGIRHVIDSGKHKRRLFRPSLNLDSLLTTSISRSSANQRSGRAGRDAPGHAYRLYTEADFYKLPRDTEPEILRCDLSQLVLTLKSHNVDNVATFPLLTPPPRRALERAMIHLLQLSALSPSTGQITPLGREMSTLPLPAPLARILLASSEPKYDCVEEIIDIVSALSVENVFLNVHHNHQRSNTQSNPLNKSASNDEEEIDDPTHPALQARANLYRREGDHLTFLSVVQSYLATPQFERKRWCEDRAISHRAMQNILDVRKQLTQLMSRRDKRGESSKSSRGRDSKKKQETEEIDPGSVTKRKDQKEEKKVDGKSGRRHQKFNEDDGDENISETAQDTLEPQTQTQIHTDNLPKPSTSTSIPTSHSTTTSSNEDLTTRILKCLLTGLHPNIARLSLTSSSTSSTSTISTLNNSSTIHPGTTYTTLSTNQSLQIHPSSILFGRKVEAIMYSEFVYTNRTYARGVSAVQLGWVVDVVGDVGRV